MKSVDYEEFVDLSKLCTIRIGGRARKVFFPKNGSQVSDLLKEGKERDRPVFPIGIGSNTVFGDGVLDRLFISTKYLKKYRTWWEGDWLYIFAEAGVSFKTLQQISEKYNLTGFENLAGIPATVGGATVMNAGAYGSEFSQIINRVYWIDGNGE
ncbi:MAG: FAD-binding protein, partial [Aquificae bacterium]|nr:FAD-binding protein [Aquificota bacterium]